MGQVDGQMINSPLEADMHTYCTQPRHEMVDGYALGGSKQGHGGFAFAVTYPP